MAHEAGEGARRARSPERAGRRAAPAFGSRVGRWPRIGTRLVLL